MVGHILLSNKVNYWTGGECQSFEGEFASWTGAKHAIALANGTVALELALKALNVGAGDEVITTPRSFVATASSIVNVGAMPVFADVDLNSQAITASSIEEKLTPLTKAVIVVHLAGMPADMDEIMELSRKHSFYVIEDCAQAHGAFYKGKSVGTIGHVGAWSFCQDKIITTAGEGGMVTTNDETLWSRMWSYKDHGKNYDSVFGKKHPPGFRWIHDTIGTNWRMTEMQAAIGRSQLSRLNSWRLKRQQNAAAINNAVKDLVIVRRVEVPEHIEHAGYKHYLFVNREWLKPDWSRDRIIAEINKRGVPAYHGSCSEIYLEKCFDNLGCRPKLPLKNAVELGESSMMFLIHPTLTLDNINTTCAVLREVLIEAQRSCPTEY